jgi:hypothetical protein
MLVPVSHLDKGHYPVQNADNSKKIACFSSRIDFLPKNQTSHLKDAYAKSFNQLGEFNKSIFQNLISSCDVRDIDIDAVWHLIDLTDIQIRTYNIFMEKFTIKPEGMAKLGCRLSGIDKEMSNALLPCLNSKGHIDIKELCQKTQTFLENFQKKSLWVARMVEIESLSESTQPLKSKQKTLLSIGISELQISNFNKFIKEFSPQSNALGEIQKPVDWIVGSEFLKCFEAGHLNLNLFQKEISNKKYTILSEDLKKKALKTAEEFQPFSSIEKKSLKLEANKQFCYRIKNLEFNESIHETLISLHLNSLDNQGIINQEAFKSSISNIANIYPEAILLLATLTQEKINALNNFMEKFSLSPPKITCLGYLLSPTEELIRSLFLKNCDDLGNFNIKNFVINLPYLYLSQFTRKKAAELAGIPTAAFKIHDTFMSKFSTKQDQVYGQVFGNVDCLASSLVLINTNEKGFIDYVELENDLNRADYLHLSNYISPVPTNETLDVLTDNLKRKILSVAKEFSALSIEKQSEIEPLRHMDDPSFNLLKYLNEVTSYAIAPIVRRFYLLDVGITEEQIKHHNSFIKEFSPGPETELGLGYITDKIDQFNGYNTTYNTVFSAAYIASSNTKGFLNLASFKLKLEESKLCSPGQIFRALKTGNKYVNPLEDASLKLIDNTNSLIDEKNNSIMTRFDFD